jgi:hypothetical protein
MPVQPIDEVHLPCFWLQANGLNDTYYYLLEHALLHKLDSDPIVRYE